MTPFGAVQNSITNNSITPTAPQPATSTATTDPLGNEQTFLQLLVAQLQYQDPTQPVSGTEFVTQLAQFSDLEQQIGSHQDLDSILQVITTPPPAPAATATPTTPASSTTPPNSSAITSAGATTTP
jgi:flagellar basal-body rod modification protein FlgD